MPDVIKLKFHDKEQLVLFSKYTQQEKKLIVSTAYQYFKLCISRTVSLKTKPVM